MRAPSGVLVLIGLLAASLLSAEEGELFREAVLTGDRVIEPRLGVVRSRPVEIDFGRLPGADGRSALPLPGHRLALNLFDDARLRARMERVQRLARGLSWVGRLEGDPATDVIIVVYDGIVFGTINGAEASYAIRWDGTGHVVEELDYSAFPDQENCFIEASAVEPPVDFEPPMVGDDGSLVDVLVVYTPAARAAAGGTAGMHSLINLAIAETNTGYSNSVVIQRLRLVGTAEVNLTESSISTDLRRLTNPSDGFIDNVHTLRDTYRADLVSLVGSNYTTQGACGIAWLMAGNNPAFEDRAFSVVDRTCMTGYYSFGHEIGHNQGLNHARVDPTGTGAYSYSYGYKDPASIFRTVMAYNCPVSCPRVLHFSNPDVSYSGRPTGIAETSPDSAHSGLSLNNTRVTVANWRVADTAGTGADFYTVTPCRVVDTRDPSLGGPNPLQAMTSRSFVLTGRCAIPATAKAVSLNVTVTQPTASGNLRIYPEGTATPTTSLINYSPFQNRANNAVAEIGAAGSIRVWCGQSSGTVHFIVDVNGYFQ